MHHQVSKCEVGPPTGCALCTGRRGRQQVARPSVVRDCSTGHARIGSSRETPKRLVHGGSCKLWVQGGRTSPIVCGPSSSSSKSSSQSSSKSSSQSSYQRQRLLRFRPPQGEVVVPDTVRVTSTKCASMAVQVDSARAMALSAPLRCSKRRLASVYWCSADRSNNEIRVACHRSVQLSCRRQVDMYAVQPVSHTRFYHSCSMCTCRTVGTVPAASGLLKQHVPPAEPGMVIWVPRPRNP